MPEQGIRNILETNVKIENIDKKQKMQRRDMKSLKLETKIPETIQSEPRKIQKKKNRACGTRTKLQHLCHQSPRSTGENIQC